MEKARRLGEEGRSVLLVCFNTWIAEWLRHTTSNWRRRRQAMARRASGVDNKPRMPKVTGKLRAWSALATAAVPHLCPAEDGDISQLQGAQLTCITIFESGTGCQNRLFRITVSG
jgi:hypothetical protein